MHLRLLGCEPTSIDVEDSASRLRSLSQVKLAEKRVQESGLLDKVTIVDELGKEVDRKGREIQTFYTDSETGWLVFNYVFAYERESLSYDIRDSLYYADIETKRPRDIIRLSRLVVVGLKPSLGRLGMISPIGGIDSLEAKALAETVSKAIPEIGDSFLELQLKDNNLMDIAEDCLQKGYDLRGASVALEDLLLGLQSSRVSLIRHPAVRGSEDTLGIINKIIGGDWNSIEIEITSGSAPYIVHLSKAKDVWDYLTLYPLRGRERIALDKAAAIFESVISLISLTLEPNPSSAKQAALSEFL